MGPVPQRSRATLELHPSSPSALATHGPILDAERAEPQRATVAAALRGFLEALGLDLTDPNLVGTDDRVARAYGELLSGLRPGAEPTLTTFPNREGHAGIVAVKDEHLQRQFLSRLRMSGVPSPLEDQ